jgi:hypothetical protein
MSDEHPSDEEISSAAEILSKLRPGYLPFSIFLEITRLVTTSIVEIVPLFKEGDKIYVLLTRRSEDDPNWPNKLHTPGTVVRATDEEGNYESAFSRILQDELRGIAIIGKPVFVEPMLHKVNRGMEDAKIFYVELAEKPNLGEFHNSEDLPEDIVDTQVAFIKLAVDKFRNN